MRKVLRHYGTAVYAVTIYYDEERGEYDYGTSFGDSMGGFKSEEEAVKAAAASVTERCSR